LFGEQRPLGDESALHEFRGTRTVGASAVLSSNPTEAALEDKGGSWAAGAASWRSSAGWARVYAAHKHTRSSHPISDVGPGSLTTECVSKGGNHDYQP
jgi:hypothetical protein